MTQRLRHRNLDVKKTLVQGPTSLSQPTISVSEEAIRQRISARGDTGKRFIYESIGELGIGKDHLQTSRTPLLLVKSDIKLPSPAAKEQSGD